MCAVRDILSNRFHAERGGFTAFPGRGDGNLRRRSSFFHSHSSLFVSFVGVVGLRAYAAHSMDRDCCNPPTRRMSSPLFCMKASPSCVRKLLLRQTLNGKKRSESLGAFYTNTRTPGGSSRQKKWGAHQIQADPVGESYTRLRSAQGSGRFW
jgi:hypothetical protein